MNAYELADALQETEPYYSTDYKLFDNAANMLRQQADQIAELEKRKWSEQDIKNACIGARLSEEDFLRIKAYLPYLFNTTNKAIK